MEIKINNKNYRALDLAEIKKIKDGEFEGNKVFDMSRSGVAQGVLIEVNPPEEPTLPEGSRR